MTEPRKIRRGVGRTETQTYRRMNKTETWYARNVLNPMIASGEINSWAYESYKIRLADVTGNPGDDHEEVSDGKAIEQLHRKT